MGHRVKSFAQLVGTIADSVGNLGASPPDPPLCVRVRGSGFGTPLRGGRRKPHANLIPESPADIWRSAPKKWEPKGSQIKVKENDAAAPLLFWHCRSCSVDPPAARPKARALARPLMRAYAALMHPRPRLLVLFAHFFTFELCVKNVL